MTTIAIAPTRVDVRPAVLAVLRWIVAIAGALVIFGVLMWTKGANPLTAYSSMFETLTRDTALSGIVIKATPLILAALAVAVPARAGLVNVGGEGQLVMGGVAAARVARLFGPGAPGGLVLVGMAVGAALVGAGWAAVGGLLRVRVGISEAVTTLLLNYIALNVMFFLIYDPWKDLAGGGQPTSPAIPVAQRLPLIGSGSMAVHAGILVALIATAAMWWVLRSTRWGFKLEVVGGNAEAARRAGFAVGLLLIGAMAVGGALAGLGGFAQLAGTEFKLRPGFLVTYGYIAFLASWLARHKPVRVAVAAVVLAAISVSGDSLQLDSRLPAATVNVLMALVLLAVFGWTSRRSEA
ncbi:MAG: ABC transporter permease [Acidimicrobiales bacterium]|nr:ABC transporter permease [Acidimicrobiales bacterium]